MLCEACERGDHEQCGMQTWCTCDCEGPDGFYSYLPDDHEQEKSVTHLPISIDPEKFDKAVHGGLDHPVLQDAGDLAIFVKPNATEGGRAAAVLTFTVKLPDGSLARVQTATTAGVLEMAFGALKGWREGGHI